MPMSNCRSKKEEWSEVMRAAIDAVMSVIGDAPAGLLEGRVVTFEGWMFFLYATGMGA